MEKHRSRYRFRRRCKNDALSLSPGGLIKWRPLLSLQTFQPTIDNILQTYNDTICSISYFHLYLFLLILHLVEWNLDEGIFFYNRLNKDQTIVSVLFMYILFY